MRVMDVEGWSSSSQDILSKRQQIYVESSHKSLSEIASNGRKNVLVVSAHQDDEVIGMGGTMRLYAEGVKYASREKLDELVKPGSRPFYLGGLRHFSIEEIRQIQRELENDDLHLNVLPEQPCNVVTVYITDGAKTEESVASDLKKAFPGKPLELILSEHEVRSLQELTKLLNGLRYPETLQSLSYVGATAAIFLQYPSSKIKLDGTAAINDLAAIIKLLRPETIYTLSPFEFSHDSHIQTSNVTLAAARQVQQDGLSTSNIFGYPVWNPNSIFHRILIDISEVFEKKLDAIHLHSVLGSQSRYGRRYEVIMGLNRLVGLTLTFYANTFAAKMQRPRLPATIHYAETFVDLTPFLRDSNTTLREFVERQFQNLMRHYPN